jgi:hypothetical protein
VVKWVVDKFMWIWGKAKTIFEGIYKTIEVVFQKVYDKVSMVFIGIRNMWNSSWNELKKIMDSWFTWVNDKVELVKRKLIEVFDGLKTKAEAAMESLKAVMEKPFNILKDTLNEVWGVVVSVFKKIWGAVKELILGAKGMFGLMIESVLRAMVRGLEAIGFLIPDSILNKVRESVDKASGAFEHFSDEAKKAFDVYDARVDQSFGHSWDKQVAASVVRASGNMGEFTDSAVGDLDRFQQMADKLGIDISGMDPKAIEQWMGALRVDPGTDTMATALVQPFMQGAEAADYYAAIAMKAFQKVAFGAQSLREAMQLTPDELNAAVRLAPQMEAPEVPANRMEARQRELQDLAQGPMRELLQATHNPQWYNDWRSTFLKAHEELKEEIRALRGPESKTQPNAQARAMPARDILGEYGFNYNRVGV